MVQLKWSMMQMTCTLSNIDLDLDSGKHWRNVQQPTDQPYTVALLYLVANCDETNLVLNAVLNVVFQHLLNAVSNTAFDAVVLQMSTAHGKLCLELATNIQRGQKW